MTLGASSDTAQLVIGQLATAELFARACRAKAAWSFHGTSLKICAAMSVLKEDDGCWFRKTFTALSPRKAWLPHSLVSSAFVHACMNASGAVSDNR
jgi:hypothetical protein